MRRGQFDPREMPAGVMLKYAARLTPATPDPHFCCWSDLWVTPDGKELKAISDNGKWLTAPITERADGTLADLQATIGDLRCEVGLHGATKIVVRPVVVVERGIAHAEILRPQPAMTRDFCRESTERQADGRRERRVNDRVGSRNDRDASIRKQ